mgnify:CR=1 FL=1
MAASGSTLSRRLSEVVGVALFARYVGFDRDRAFYPTVMIVIASYYVLFAAMSGSVQTGVIESVVMTLFAAAAVAGASHRHGVAPGTHCCDAVGIKMYYFTRIS